MIFHIQGKNISNTLADLGETINIMTKETWESLILSNIRPTPIVLDLTNFSTIRIEIILDGVIISVES